MLASALVLVSVLSSAPAEAGLPVDLQLSGNKVLPSSVYFAVLRLAPEAKADEATAKEVAGQLQGFLLVSGYVLADVRAQVVGDAIFVEIDEGQLERVVFKGALTLNRVRLALGLNLPHYVFNQPDFEAQVKRHEAALGVPIMWKLVPARDVEHLGPQLTQVPAIRGLTLVPEAERMELEVTTGEPDWPVGLGLDLRTSYFDGIELGVNYQGVDLGAIGSRFRVAFSAGLGVRGTFYPFSLLPAFSRATAEFKWLAPQLKQTARPYIHFEAEQISRMRVDVNLLTYQATTGNLSLNVVLSPAPEVDLAISLGAQVRSVYGLERFDPAQPLPPGEPVSLRPFAALQLSVLFSPRDGRWDTEHRFTARVRYFVGALAPDWGEARVRYKRTVNLGWHELRFKVSGVYLWGHVGFHDEDSLPDPHLRGVFIEQWVLKAGSFSSEFRFSLIRDLLMLSVFTDVAVFGLQDRELHTESPMFGVSVGPGIHFLFEGTIMFDLTFSTGVLANGTVRFGPMLLVNKVL